MDSEEQSDGYEEVGHKSNQHATDKERIKRPNRPTALELVGPKGPSRTLWSEIPEVINSEILCKSIKNYVDIKIIYTTLKTYYYSHTYFDRETTAGIEIRDTHIGGILSQVANTFAHALHESSGIS